jgi:F0F1-type ATP synthase epsilon subunit
MAEVATPVASLDKPALEEEVESLQEAITKTDALADQAPYHKSLKIAQAKIDAINDYQRVSAAEPAAA